MQTDYTPFNFSAASVAVLHFIHCSVTGRAFNRWTEISSPHVSQIPYEPSSIRSSAFYEGEKTIEGITAVRISQPAEISSVWEKGRIPLLIDPANEIRHTLKPHVLVDAILVSVARPQKEPERQFPDVSGASCSLQHERVRPAYAFSYKHFPWQDYPQQVQFDPNCGALVSLSEFKYLMASHCLFTRSSKLMKSKKLLFSRKTIKINFR